MTPENVPIQLNGKESWTNEAEKLFIDHIGYWCKPQVNSRKKLLFKYLQICKDRVRWPNMTDRETVIAYIKNAIEKECLA